MPTAKHAGIFAGTVYDSGGVYTDIAYPDRDPDRSAFVDETKITAPILTLGGAKDRAVPISDVRLLAEKYSRIGGDYLEYPEHGHWIVDEPGSDQVIADIDTWLASKGLTPDVAPKKAAAKPKSAPAAKAKPAAKPKAATAPKAKTMATPAAKAAPVAKAKAAAKPAVKAPVVKKAVAAKVATPAAKRTPKLKAVTKPAPAVKAKAAVKATARTDAPPKAAAKSVTKASAKAKAPATTPKSK